MNAQMVIETDFRKKAEEELQSIRENCHKWTVDDNITQMREYLTSAGLSLADVGTSEDEIQSCLKTGRNSAAHHGPRVSSEMTRALEEMLGRC